MAVQHAPELAAVAITTLKATRTTLRLPVLHLFQPSKAAMHGSSLRLFGARNFALSPKVVFLCDDAAGQLGISAHDSLDVYYF